MDIGIIKYFIKNRLANFMYNFGFSKLYLKKKMKQSALILAYHRIRPKSYIESNMLMNGMYISTEAFESQISWLKNNYKVVPLADIINDISHKIQWQTPRCAITFDDGWKDNYDYGFPILIKHNLPATIFVIGNYIGKSEPNCYDTFFEIVCSAASFQMEIITSIPIIDNFLKQNDVVDIKEKARLSINMLRKLSYRDFRKACESLNNNYYRHLNTNHLNKKYSMLSFNNMREMAKHKIDFGYHSKSHFMLTKIPNDKLKDEIAIPDALFAKHNINIKRFFCYPDGQLNKRIISLLTKSGYIGATSLISGFNSINTNPFALKRFNLHEGNSSTIPLFLATIGNIQG